MKFTFSFSLPPYKEEWSENFSQVSSARECANAWARILDEDIHVSVWDREFTCKTNTHKSIPTVAPEDLYAWEQTRKQVEHDAYIRSLSMRPVTPKPLTIHGVNI